MIVAEDVAGGRDAVGATLSFDRCRPWASMTVASRFMSFRRFLLQQAGRIPLRVQLITALLGLLAMALIAISFAGVAVLRGYLQGRADRQVLAEYNGILNELAQQSSPGISVGGGLGSVNGFPYIVEIRNQNGLIPQPFGFERPSQYEPKIPVNAGWLKANSGRLVTVPSFSGKDSWRIITRQISYQVGNPETGEIVTKTGMLVVGVDVGDITGTIHRLTYIDLIVSGIVLLCLAIVGVTVVRASLGPLTDIERTAVVIARGDLSRRVPERDPRTEVGSLGQSLNAMLSQIETAFRARTESEAAARSSEAAARRSESRMRQFVADASHELRTPLAVISGYLEYFQQRMGLKNGRLEGHGRGTLSDEAPSNARAAACESPSDAFTAAEQASSIRRIEEESRRMAGLVEDLLLLARLDRERPIEHKPVDLLALAAGAVNDARVIASDRAINLTMNLDKAALVLGDQDQLRRVISNLMTNALKHTPDGSQIDVRLSAATVNSQPGVALEVVDQGPGLQPDQASRVFERFYRADQARARKTGGSGLGLSIVAALVAAHGGAATVESQPGHGATFRVALPLAPDVIAAAGDSHGIEGAGEPVPR